MLCCCFVFAFVCFFMLISCSHVLMTSVVGLIPMSVINCLNPMLNCKTTDPKLKERIMCCVIDYVKRMGLSLAPFSSAIEKFLLDVSSEGALGISDPVSALYGQSTALYGMGLLLGKAKEGCFALDTDHFVKTMCTRCMAALEIHSKDDSLTSAVLYALLRALKYCLRIVPDVSKGMSEKTFYLLVNCFSSLGNCVSTCPSDVFHFWRFCCCICQLHGV